MDFRFGHVDSDCTLNNPLVVASFFVSAMAVALTVGFAFSRRGSLLKRVGLAVGALVVAGGASVALGAGLFRLLTRLEMWRRDAPEAWSVSIGCMQSTRPWIYPLLVATLSALAVGFSALRSWRSR